MKQPFLYILACILLVGCSSPDLVNAPHGGVKDPLPAAAYPQVVFQDQLENDLVVGQPPAVIRQDGSQSLRVHLTFRSVSDQQVNIRVKFLFYGPNGEVVTDNPAWQSFAVPPRSKINIDGDSITDRAVKWEAQVARES